MEHAGVPVSKNLVVPLGDVAPGVQGLRIGFLNVFGVEHTNGSWTLIDAGVPYSAGYIHQWAEKNFRRPPTSIVLTHGHFDHVSAAPWLAEHWNVPVYAHELEAPYLTGEREYPAPNPGAGGGLMSLLSPIYPRGPVDLSSRLQLLHETDHPMQSGAMPGWQILHTPGHTEGHISLFRPADKTLIVGDAFCTTKPESFFDSTVAQPPELHGPPAYFTSDYAKAAQSVQRLAALEPRILAPGHGKPIAGFDVEFMLAEFSRRYDAEAEERSRHVA